MRAPCPCRDASLIVWGLARVITTCLLPHLLHPQVHDRSAEFWNFAFVSSIVIEYKDTRNLLPAPFNAFGVLALIPRTLYRCVCRFSSSGLRRLSIAGGALEPAREKPSTSCEGYTWMGGGASYFERSSEARRHRRKQQAMCARCVHAHVHAHPASKPTALGLEPRKRLSCCDRPPPRACGRHMRVVEEEAALALDAQVQLITKRQADMDTKQDQRLESLASGLTSLHDAMMREGLIMPSPRSHRSMAASNQGTPTGTGGFPRAPSHRRPPEVPSPPDPRQRVGAADNNKGPVPPLLNAKGLEALQQKEQRREDLRQRHRAAPQHPTGNIYNLGPVPDAAPPREYTTSVYDDTRSARAAAGGGGMLGFTPTMPPSVAAKLGMKASAPSAATSVGPSPSIYPTPLPHISRANPPASEVQILGETPKGAASGWQRPAATPQGGGLLAAEDGGHDGGSLIGGVRVRAKEERAPATDRPRDEREGRTFLA